MESWCSHIQMVLADSQTADRHLGGHFLGSRNSECGDFAHQHQVYVGTR